MSEAWKGDFPVAWTDDHYVTRREFTKSLALVSGAVCAANGALWAMSKVPAVAVAPARVASAGELAVGGWRLFEHGGERWLLVRLAPERWVAVGQKCTHLGCPVLWKAADRRFHCPCHEGYFDEEGRVLAGPPPRPLPRLEIKRIGEDLWAGPTTS